MKHEQCIFESWPWKLAACGHPAKQDLLLRPEAEPWSWGVTGKTNETRKGFQQASPSCRSIRNLGHSPAYLGAWVMSALLPLLWSNKCQAKWLDCYPARYGMDPAPTGASWSLSMGEVGRDWPQGCCCLPFYGAHCLPPTVQGLRRSPRSGDEGKPWSLQQFLARDRTPI